jgi:type II secretory pathway component GspD/PulD (secretin)
VKAQAARDKLVEVFGDQKADKKQTHTIVVDERLNAILVSGPAEFVAKVKKILDEIDKVPVGKP